MLGKTKGKDVIWARGSAILPESAGSDASGQLSGEHQDMRTW